MEMHDEWFHNAAKSTVNIFIRSYIDIFLFYRAHAAWKSGVKQAPIVLAVSNHCQVLDPVTWRKAKSLATVPPALRSIDRRLSFASHMNSAVDACMIVSSRTALGQRRDCLLQPATAQATPLQIGDSLGAVDGVVHDTKLRHMSAHA